MEENINVNTEVQSQETQNTEVVNTETTQEVENKTTEIDYSKLESIVNKGIAQKESGILKSFFKEAGLSESEIKDAINSYKENKTKSQPDVKTLQDEIAQYKDQIKQNAIDTALKKSLKTTGIDKKNMDFVKKLVDTKEFVENDKINNEKLNEVLTNLLTAFPALKSIEVTEEKKNGIVDIGSNIETNTVQTTAKNTNLNQPKPWNRFR